MAPNADGTYSRRCNVDEVEHRITYRIDNGDRQEAWVEVHSGHSWVTLYEGQSGPAAFNHQGQSSVWWDYPDELFATNDRQLLRVDAGGNTRLDVNGLVSPSSLLIELWNGRQVMAQLQRCAQRYVDDGLLRAWQPPTGVGELLLGPNGRVLGIPGGFDASLDGDVPTDGEWDWWVDEP